MELASSKIVHLITRTEKSSAQLVGRTSADEFGVVARSVVVRAQANDRLVQSSVTSDESGRSRDVPGTVV